MRSKQLLRSLATLAFAACADFFAASDDFFAAHGLHIQPAPWQVPSLHTAWKLLKLRSDALSRPDASTPPATAYMQPMMQDV